ncbi:MAG TPA: hypothetical protein VLC94_05880, partial [Candidatus Acidoferrum sp.]|nr:hypothetical protein [Candidatus Acidoferrum sp.]
MKSSRSVIFSRPHGLVLFSALLLSLWTVACGGGGGSVPTPPPPTGNFSNASLKGQYAFSMSGEDGVTGSFFARVGSFTADGNGNITAGIEDVNTALNGPQTITFPAASTYSVQADGRGILNINGSGPLSFSITMLSPNQGLIVETDLNATASGTFYLQDPNAFSTGSVQGNYVFDFSGLDPGGAPDSIVGQLVSNGSGGLTGVLDENDNAVSTGASSFAGATYQLDATNGPTFGRGLMTFTSNGFTFNYVFYVVNSSRIRFIETGSAALTVGDALAQTSVPTTAANFNGNFVFLLNGNGTSGPITRVGRFTADGNGGLNSLFANTNDAGTVAVLPKGTLSAATYAIDSAFPGSGRGTLTFTDSSLGKFSFIFYLSSASGGVIQDVSVNNNKGNVGDGTLQLQTGGPFTSFGGDYGLNFTGISSNGSTQLTGEEDYVGHLNFASNSANGNVSGAVDFSEFSSNQGAFFNVVVSGTGLTIGGDGTTSSGTRNALSLKLNSSPSSTLN